MATQPMPDAPPVAEPKKAKPPKKKRRWLRALGILLGIPLLLILLGLAYLHTSAGKAKIRAAIIERLQQRVDGQVEVGVVDYALFGDVKLGDVHVKDNAGAEVAVLSSLTVDPSWTDLIAGRIVIERVTLSGLAVHVVKDADGGSNIKRLLKPQPPADPQKKPLDKRIEIQALSIGGVAVDITQPDGTKILLSEFGVEGAIALQPAQQVVDVEVSKIALGVLIDKGEGGLKLGLTGLETGVTVKLERGVGKATLHPLKGHVSITLPVKPAANAGGDANGAVPAPAENPPREFDIGLEELSADIGEDGMGVSLDKLLAGALALASVEVKGRVAEGKMDGDQQADVLGLKVSGERVNELLGKPVLLGDIDIETHIKGPPDKIEVDANITTPGAKVSVDGSVGVADPANPVYDVALTVTDVDTEKLLAKEMGVAPVVVEKVEVAVKGKGAKADSASAVAKVKVTNATAKGVRIDGVDFEGELDKGVLKIKSVEAKALGQRVTASGDVELATKRIDLAIGVQGDVGDALGQLKAAGIPIKSNLPRGAVRLADGDLQITAKGHLNGAIDVQANAKRVGVLGGSVKLDARASIVRHDPPLEDGKKVTVTAMDADLKVGGIKLSSILAMRGKKLKGMDGTLSGDVHVEGTPQKPRAKLLLGLVTTRDDGGKTLRLSVTGDVSPHAADVKASLTPSDGATEIFGLRAKLPLSMGGAKKGIDPYAPIDVHAELTKKKLNELWAYVPSAVHSGTIQGLPEGDVALTLDVKGTAAKPDGHFHTTLTAQLLGPPLTQKVEIDAVLQPNGDGLAAKTTADAWFDVTKPKLAHVGGQVDLSRSPILGPPEVAYNGKVEVGPVDLDPIWKVLKKDFVGGKAVAAIELKGNKEDVTARATVIADDFHPKADMGPIGLDVLADVGDASTNLDVKVRVAEGVEAATAHLADPAQGRPAKIVPANSRLLSLAGKVELGGKKLFAKLKDKEHLDPPLALTIDIPKRALATLASLRPKLVKAPGNLSGSIAVNGTAKVPLAKGSVILDDVEKMDGKKGGLGLVLDANKEQILANIGVGVTKPSEAPIQIAIVAPREPLTKMSEGVVAPVTATIRGPAVDLRTVVPAAAVGDTKVGVTGTLDWNMDIKAGLTKGKAGIEPAEGTITGLLDVHGATVALPGTKRAYHDVNLYLKADGNALHLDSLRAKETDIEVKNRSVVVKGEVTLDKLLPTKANVVITADKWLLFGPRALGFADAPRGTLTLAANAKADFTQTVKSAAIAVTKLELLAPDRFERAHQPEDVHVGDLVYLDEGKVKGMGQVPVPDSVAEKAKPKKVEPPKTGMFDSVDIDIDVAEGARVLQSPLDLSPKGHLTVQIRPTERKTRGKLEIVAGELSLGGAMHQIEKGSITFDEQNPTGYIDLHFAHPMKPSALRDVSEASGGQAVKIHMFGPLADRKTILSGAGSPGALWDLLSMHNVGRERYVSGPDMPESITVDFPQHDSLLVLSFLSVNLPHLLFLDRLALWADPYDDPRAYGRLTHLEAERFLSDGSVRVRAGTRPPSAGQSEAEVELDYLFVNVPRMLFGVGLTGGTRGGGGPGVVWEWSSKD